MVNQCLPGSLLSQLHPIARPPCIVIFGRHFGATHRAVVLPKHWDGSPHISGQSSIFHVNIHAGRGSSTCRMILVQSLKCGSRNMLQLLPSRWEGNLMPQQLLGHSPCHFSDPRTLILSCDGKKSKWLLFCITQRLQHLAPSYICQITLKPLVYLPLSPKLACTADGTTLTIAPRCDYLH
jgi:hypothetical protein